MKALTVVLTLALTLVSQLGVAKSKKATVAVICEAPKPSFTLTLPDMWMAQTFHNKMVLTPASRYPHIQVWNVTTVKNLDEAVKDIRNIIKSEVIQFKVKETAELTIGGKPAKRLTGTGLEADDQDPSKADAFLFTANGKVFILCVHGEGDEAHKIRPTVKKILETFKLVK